ncbi:MAG: porin [Azoarcus sp.]|jgi:outer membrane protein OmpU|nr:porin [Azoarcus sp.]
MPDNHRYRGITSLKAAKSGKKRKDLLTLPIFLCAAASFSANAQSNVTIYGSAVDGIARISNVDGGRNRTKLQSGGTWSNYIGVTGKENLGNGISAAFTISKGYDINTGANWPAVSHIGLSSTSAGTLTLGRQYDYMNDLVPVSIVSSSTLYAFHPGGYDRAQGVELDNTISYVSPVLGGFQFKGLYGFSEQVSGLNKKKHSHSLGMNYTNGGFKGILAHTSVGGGTIRPGTDAGMADFLGESFASNRDHAISLKKTDMYAAAVNYKLGDFTYKGAITAVKFFATSGAKDILRNIEGSVLYQFSPKILLNLGHTHSSSGDRKWRTTSASADYSFSKRTDVMLAVNHQSVSGEGQVASLFAAGNSSSRKQTVLYLGARHLF